jgi:methylmalonyl-CoA/ethylmalonyl-CoA epimerase
MLKRIDHIGIVVDDLDEGKRFLEGLGFTHVHDLTRPERAIHASFWKCGDAAIELMQMDDPEANRKRMQGESLARIEHIAIEVDDLEATIEQMRTKGVEMTGPPSRFVGTGTISVSTRPETSDGYQLQLTKKTDMNLIATPDLP